MFDEISVGKNLCFSQKFDCIEGFEDLGSWGKPCNIANHALAAVACIESNQPVAYNFRHGSTKMEMIAQFINQVLDVCQNAGLKVVATVSGMGANNAKALKLLGATKRKPSFKFHNQEIATVYDLPHLQKCTQNLFLKYDVQFEV
jgi:hypothetical protein